MRFTVLALAAFAALAAVPVAPPAAPAAISGVTAVDGPSADVIDVGGVAMAEDGTGGIVYRKRTEGRAHVYAAQFIGGRWQASQRVDTGQSFDSSWPRIGAANGGHLVVTWVQEFGPGSDRLFSATLDPGAKRFQAAVPIDLNVGEALATHPALAMNRGGGAYLAYRVLAGNGQPDPNAPPGYYDADVRVARYTGRLWSLLGFPADRNEGAPVATPTAANGPRIGVDVAGNAIVAFQEPDDDFIDRVWARRVFGASFGVPLAVGPRQAGGRPLRGPVDAFALDVTGFGQGAIALRQQPGQDSALAGPHVFVTTIPEAFSPSAGAFAPPLAAGGPVERALPASPGPPSVGVTPEGLYRLAFGIGRGALEATGTDGAVAPPVALGDGAGAVEPGPLVEVAESEAAVTAWRARSGVVALRETLVDGRHAVKGLSAGPGPVRDLALAGSNLGDGLVAFVQGSPDAARVAAAVVDAPALDFAVQVPLRFVRNRKVRVEWDAARNALGPLEYAVYIGGRRVARSLGRTSYRLATRRVRDGRRALRVVATDRRGQRTKSLAATLRLDRTPPRVRITTRRGRVVRLRMVDGRRGRVAGPSRSRIRWGDGRSSRATRARHRYRRAGRYTIVVRARDRAGNRRTVRSRVRVR